MRKVTLMDATKPRDTFEQILLSYVEMLYRVALALTRSPEAAEDLTRRTLVDAWRLRNKLNGGIPIKTRLLTMLRESFIQEYQLGPSLPSLAGEPKRVSTIQVCRKHAKSSAGSRATLFA